LHIINNFNHNFETKVLNKLFSVINLYLGSNKFNPLVVYATVPINMMKATTGTVNLGSSYIGIMVRAFASHL